MSDIADHHCAQDDEESTAVEHHASAHEHRAKQDATGDVICTFTHGAQVKEHRISHKVVSALGDPKARIDGLAPPVGTMFHGRRTYTMWDIPFEYMNGWLQIRWIVDAYTYASGADPRSPDFAQQGGRIYVVLVTRGFTQTGHGISDGVWNSIKFKIDPIDSGLEPMAQLPPTGSGIKQDDDYHYTIDFEQRLQMFKNLGHETFTFDAKYKDDFVLTLAKQLGSRGQTIEFGIETTKTSSAHRHIDLYGLSVFTHTDPRAFPLQLDRYFDAKGGGTVEAKEWVSTWFGKWELELGFDLS